MYQRLKLTVWGALFCIAMVAGAQSYGFASTQQTDRPFAFVFDSAPVSYNGVGRESQSLLQQYVETHRGRYLVFEERGSLYRLDDVTSVETAERQLVAIRPLQAREQALSEKQKPLEQRMQVLSKKINAAQSAEERSAIGEQMNGLGNQIGRLGEEQGRVGNQLGAMANAFYQSAQAMFSRCLANGECRKV